MSDTFTRHFHFFVGAFVFLVLVICNRPSCSQLIFQAQDTNHMSPSENSIFQINRLEKSEP